MISAICILLFVIVGAYILAEKPEHTLTLCIALYCYIQQDVIIEEVSNAVHYISTVFSAL